MSQIATSRPVVNTVVPVIDFAAHFRRAGSAVGKRSCIVSVEVGEGIFRPTWGSWSMRLPK